jgi:hypothetical protein
MTGIVKLVREHSPMQITRLLAEAELAWGNAGEDLEEPRVRAAITELVAAGELAEQDGRLSVPAPALSGVEARVLAVCKDKRRTRKQIAAACKDYLPADVDTAIDRLVAAKRLALLDDTSARFVAAPAPATA